MWHPVELGIVHSSGKDGEQECPLTAGRSGGKDGEQECPLTAAKGRSWFRTAMMDSALTLPLMDAPRSPSAAKMHDEKDAICSPPWFA